MKQKPVRRVFRDEEQARARYRSEKGESQRALGEERGHDDDRRAKHGVTAMTKERGDHRYERRLASLRPLTWLRRCLGVVAAAALATALAGATSPAPAQTGTTDADLLWSFVKHHYAYLDAKQTDWDAAGRYYRAKYASAGGDRARFGVLEAMLDELYDAHSHLDSNYADSWRLPAFNVWAQPRDGRIVITDVRPGTALEPLLGSEILAIDGRPPSAAIAARLPRFLRHPDPAATQWALLSALSGRHDTPVRITIRDGSGVRDVQIAAAGNPSGPSQPVTSRRVENDVGVIGITSFGDASTVAAFDKALAGFHDTKALVIDVRENSGGDTDVTLPIMGRFLARRKQYAWMARREGKSLGPRWPEFIDPRGPWTYRGKVVVLVDRWTESVAEGFAMGLQETRGAIVVGTPMAGLGAAVLKTHLPQNDVDVQISAEPVYSLDGRPRSVFQPTIPIDLTQARGVDPIFAAGLAAAR